jgi:hypothetical protein
LRGKNIKGENKKRGNVKERGRMRKVKRKMEPKRANAGKLGKI